MRKNPALWLYLGLSFGSTWICWGLIAWFSQYSLFVMLNAQMLIAATMWLPGISALLVKALFGKKEQLNFGLRPRFRKLWGYWAAAWLMPLALTLLGAVVWFAAAPQSFDPALGQLGAAVDIYSMGNGRMFGGLILGLNLLIAPFFNLIFAAGEEIGWRGYLYPALRRGMSSAKAALVSGLIWGLWHAPIIALGHNYGTDYTGWPFAGIAAMCLFCIGFGGLLVWLRERTQNVWPAALAHGALNAVAALPTLLLLPGASVNPLLGPAPVGLIAGLPTLLCGLLCIRGLKRNVNGTTDERKEKTA